MRPLKTDVRLPLPIRSFTAPYSIEKGEAFLWTVFLTNSLAVPARLDVAARTDVFDERGALLQRLSYVMTTNCLAPGETKLISFPFENFEKRMVRSARRLLLHNDGGCYFKPDNG